MPGYWLKAVGHARGPLAEDWLDGPTTLDAAPPVEAIGVAARSMSQQSHIRIERGHYERAVEALASIAL